MRYLLDANIFIAVISHENRVVMRRMAMLHHQIAVSTIVLHELYFGAYNSQRIESNLAKITEIGLTRLEFSVDDAKCAGNIRANLRRAGKPIGTLDTLIAGQALARGLVMVTANVKEFSRVQGLQIENWTEEHA